MRLVPRQLQRAGMTGGVPYYGGRLTPAQAHAAAHPTPSGPDAAAQRARAVAALDELRAAGVITDAERAALAARLS